MALRNQERDAIAVLWFGTRCPLPNLVPDLDVWLSSLVVGPELLRHCQLGQVHFAREKLSAALASILDRRSRIVFITRDLTREFLESTMPDPAGLAALAEKG